jgi:peptide/nickel transport system permease protein
MGRYLLRRLLLMIPTVFGASVVVFVGLRIVPGDPVQMMVGDNASGADVARFRAELGLDSPIYVQYVRWLIPMLGGDFGRSLRAQDSVMNVIMQAFPTTIQLAVLSLVIAAIIGITAGIVAAVRQYSLLDNALMVTVLFGVSMPAFWSGLVMILVFGLYLRWLPLGGSMSDTIIVPRITGASVIDSIIQGNGKALWDSLQHLLLPAITLGFPSMAIIARQVRAAMIEVLSLEYVNTARSKGLAARTVILRHALPNAMIPVVTVIGLQMGYLMSGAIITETVFSLPGMGRLAILSITNRDYPVVQAFVILTVTIFAGVNLLVDVVYAFINPRIRFS